MGDVLARMSDGYWYRAPGAKLPEGPFALKHIEALRRGGDIDESTKVWKTVCGNVYKVELGRRYSLDRVCSCDSWGHICEILMIVLVCACTMFSMTLLDWKDPREAGARKLLVVMAVFTVVLVVATIRKVGGRWQKVSSDTFVSEV